MPADDARRRAIRELADLLRETEARHAGFETTHAEHAWTDWYAAYLDARGRGEDPASADAAATRYMEDVLDIRRA